MVCLFRALLPEDIFLKISSSTWFFQVKLSSIRTPIDLAFSTWLIFFLSIWICICLLPCRSNLWRVPININNDLTCSLCAKCLSFLIRCLSPFQGHSSQTQPKYYCWPHDDTKIQTTKLSILLRFYFHGALEQPKTNF